MAATLRMRYPLPRNVKRKAMNKDIIAGSWKQLKGKIQAQWGDLMDDDAAEFGSIR